MQSQIVISLEGVPHHKHNQLRYVAITPLYDECQIMDGSKGPRLYMAHSCMVHW